MLSSNRRLKLGLAGVGVVLVAGTIGYMWLEGMGFLDAVYFTLITISTVGFGEPVGGLSPSGQVFTIAVLTAGVGSVLYTAATGFETIVEGVVGGARTKRRQLRRIHKMQDHIIICGFGRVGETTRSHLEPDETLVIEVDEERAGRARTNGVLVLEGDATLDSVLEEAHVRSARALIACVASDSDNIAIALSARELSPNLLIVARANEADSARKLRLAGADRVVAPLLVGAERLAAMATHPDLAEFIDIAAKGDLIEFRVEEAAVGPDSAICDKTIRESGLREVSGALILAVKEKDGTVHFSPGPELMLRAGDTAVVVGTADQLQRAIDFLSGSDM